MPARRRDRPGRANCVHVLVGASLATALLLGGGGREASAQQYRVRLDGSLQGVTFRGLQRDSVLAAAVVAGPNGGAETADGYAVRCGAASYCYYFRPGERLRAAPLSTTASAIVWGLGIDGLSVHAIARAVKSLGDDKAWPGRAPSLQLLEGYVEYQRAEVTARLGRHLVSSRLEPIAFDGAWARARFERASLDVAGYAGWGLAQATAIPVSNPALNPLDEWRPRDRQYVAGAEAAWRSTYVDARGEYRREIDARDRNFVSERVAISAAARVADWRAAAGLDYDIAQGRSGSADIALTHLRPRTTATAGVRRYRPYFSLWTLWGAYSPVGYTSVHGTARIRASERLGVSLRGERYRYDDAEISTALLPQLRNSGWRGNISASLRLAEQWTVDASVAGEAGPGAGGRFLDGGVEYAASEKLTLALYGGRLQRPLELRYYDADNAWVGARGEWNPEARRRLWGEFSITSDERERPDRSAWTLTTLRVRAGVSLTFGTNADRAPLPPARPLGR